MNKIIRIATRESQLALWQANHIRRCLLECHPDLTIELLPMRTSGDKFLKDKLKVIGSKGLFVKELEEALLTHQADLAVHSMKDVPASFPEGLILPIICERGNPLDAFVSSQFSNASQLPEKAIVGTSSLRRQAQILNLRPDLQVKTLRGNVQSRLKKLDQGEYDAIILASAGLERLSLDTRIADEFSPVDMLPACGQGALGIECRADDPELQSLISSLHHALSATCVEAERRVNAHMGGNCHAPIAVYCWPDVHNQLQMHARIFSVDGKTIISAKVNGMSENIETMAEECAESLTRQGGLKLIEMALKSS